MKGNGFLPGQANKFERATVIAKRLLPTGTQERREWLGNSLQTSNAEYCQKMVFGICSLTIVKFKRQSNEETENQVFGNILPLLVCPFGLAGGWIPEVSRMNCSLHIICPLI
jgi:hypothetical protein